MRRRDEDDKRSSAKNNFLSWPRQFYFFLFLVLISFFFFLLFELVFGDFSIGGGSSSDVAPPAIQQHWLPSHSIIRMCPLHCHPFGESKGKCPARSPPSLRSRSLLPPPALLASARDGRVACRSRSALAPTRHGWGASPGGTQRLIPSGWLAGSAGLLLRLLGWISAWILA